MKLGILVNNIKTEEPGYTTTRLAMAAINRWHEVWVMGAGDLAYDPDEFIRARARSAPRSVYKSSDTYINDLQGRQGRTEADHGGRSGHAPAPQRPLRRPDAAGVGAGRGDRLWPSGHAPRGDCS